MARKLTQAQELILDQYPDTTCVDDIPTEVIESIVALNDYETVYQDIDRYLWDKASPKRFTTRTL